MKIWKNAVCYSFFIQLNCLNLVCCEDKIEKTNKDCGLILGMRYKKGYIYMIDAYNGLLKVNLNTSELMFL